MTPAVASRPRHEQVVARAGEPQPSPHPQARHGAAALAGAAPTGGARPAGAAALTGGARPAGAAPQTRSGIRRWLPRLLWAAGLAVAVVAVRGALPELREGLAAVGRAHGGLLALALGTQVAALASLPLTFRAALGLLGGGAGYGAALDGTLGAFALSRVVPGGGLAGGVYAARRFARAGNPMAVAGGAVAIAGTATMLMLGAIVAAGAVTEAASGRGSIALVWWLAGFLTVMVAGVAALRRFVRDPQRLDVLAAWAARRLRRPAAAAQWGAHLRTLATALARPGDLARVIVWSALNWALQLLGLWLIFAAFGVSMPVGVLVLGFGAANLVTALPHTPGGLGVVEAGMTATYVAMGVPMSTALVGVLCYRLLGHWLPVAAALPLVFPSLSRTRERGTS